MKPKLSLLALSLAAFLSSCTKYEAVGYDGGAASSTDGATAPTADATAMPDAPWGEDHFDAAPSVDAMPPNLSCMGIADPTTAVDPLVLSGSIMDLVSKSGIDGAAMEAFQISDDALLASGATMADGTFSLSIPTGGTALDAYAKASKAGYADTYFFPGYPTAMGASGLQLVMAAPDQVGFIYLLGGVARQEGTATALTVVVDCAGQFVKGAQVALDPPAGKIAYLREGTTAIDSTSTETASDGVAIGMNVPVSTDMTLSATWNGHAFRSHKIKTRANAVVLTIIHP